MPVSISIQQPISQADKDAIIADTVAQVNANSSINDLGSLTTDPTTPLNGNFWYNSTEQLQKIKLPSGVQVLDTKGDLIIQDLSGNTIGTD